MAVIAWPDSMTPVESTRVTIFGDSTRLESRWRKWWVELNHVEENGESSEVTYFTEWLVSSHNHHNQWLENRHFYKIIFTKSLNSWWTTQFVGKQANEHFLFEWWSWLVQSFCIYSSSFVASELGLLIRLRDFAKTTLTLISSHWLRLESSHSVKNVPRVASPLFSSWLESSPSHQKSWLES